MHDKNKEKTGQSIDRLKEDVICPALVELISESFSDQQISILEIGSGDGTSIAHLIKLLSTNKLLTKQLTVVEADSGIFADLTEKVLVNPDFRQMNLTFMEPNVASIFGPLLDSYESYFEIANAQLVFHQIENEALLLLYLAKSFMALKDAGIFLLTELHPNYIDYLLSHESEKIMHLTSQTFHYSFDSGGTQFLKNRNLKNYSQLAVLAGFQCQGVRVHDLSPVLAYKERYQYLLRNKIPMVYTLKFQKNAHAFLSYSEGKVKRVLQEGQYLRIIFQDNSVRDVPFTPTIEIQPSSMVAIQQLRHPRNQNAIITNLWVYPQFEIEKAKLFTSVATVTQS